MNMKSIFFAAALLVASVSQAITPSIAYQGVLKGATGESLQAKTTKIDFRLYKDRAGGTPLWGRSCAILLDANGLFNVELSDTNGQELQGATHVTLKDALKDARQSSALYIGLTVENSSGEISPRQKILTVPFATYAQDVDKAEGNFTVMGQAKFNQDVGMQKTLTVSQKATFNGEIESSKKLTVNADIVAGKSGKFVGYGIVPIGTILMYWGDRVPDGWALCDGQNGTPDLRDRFVVCAGRNYRKGDIGGQDRVTLTEGEMPRHSHHFHVSTVGFVASWNEQGNAVAAPGEQRNNGRQTFGPDNGQKGVSWSGGGQSHENRPPYIAVTYIIRVK